MNDIKRFEHHHTPDQIRHPPPLDQPAPTSRLPHAAGPVHQAVPDHSGSAPRPWRAEHAELAGADAGAQRDNANRRGIPFRFSLLEWRRRWLMELAKLEGVSSMRLSYWDCSHYVRGALMKHNTSGSTASMMHVT